MQKIAVIKCGGSIVDDLSDDFFNNIKTLQENGIKPVIVHGGGPAIQKMLDELDIEFSFIDGLRTTSAAAMDVVEMVLSGQINNAITRKLNKAGIQAAGFSGSDAHLITCTPIDFPTYGYVGEVNTVNAAFLEQITAQNIVPVIVPIATGQGDERYNVNADTAAGAVAQATGAGELIFVTDVPGVMQEGELRQSASEKEIEELIDTGVIDGGMIPKVKAALSCLSDSLQYVMIADVNQVVGKAGFTGTRITNRKEAAH
ncbi:acetylglutamate kinase [Lentibacillus amyloliquefaciens]|uniref:Acetylglutamate kinase n=1 Tax=Lentibacillus amyloliquefaciens TaxID=1472767 RepID=A0A0U3W5J6_9BACI|nr:acetylglutamate kinase [Lentibacillus amyloliquefaciens]ALX48450.1 acetylglutamate kinase [Lentibacillus amyloliquefaciens]